jgi:hypothetical protein
MKKNLILASLALVLTAPSAMATGPLPDGTSRLNAILQGHGQPGDTATSASNPEVSFRVLENGLIERTNARYGTVAYVNPESEARQLRGR